MKVATVCITLPQIRRPVCTLKDGANRVQKVMITKLIQLGVFSMIRISGAMILCPQLKRFKAEQKRVMLKLQVIAANLARLQLILPLMSR